MLLQGSGFWLRLFVSAFYLVYGFNNAQLSPLRRSHSMMVTYSSFTSTIVTEDNNIKTNSSRKNREDTNSGDLHLAFPGGGIMFYWQAGIITYLRENQYDLSSCSLCGASAGALTATLTTFDVDFYKATDLALSLAEDAGVWKRAGGLQGIWGPMIFEWLDILLPNKTLITEGGRLTLLVTPIPSFGKKQISSFIDRRDLIQCNMASVHLPWFLDGKLTSDFRTSPHIDGSFLSKPSDYEPEDQQRKTLFLDWKRDPVVSKKGGFDVVEALSPDGIYGLLEQGKIHAKLMENNGDFQNLKKKYT